MTDLTINVCLFSVCLVLCHVLMFVFGGRPHFWTVVVEYIWLAGAVLGLIGLTERARQIELQSEIRIDEARVDYVVEVARGNAARLLRYAQVRNQRGHTQWDTGFVSRLEFVVQKLDEPLSTRPWEEILKRDILHGNESDSRDIVGKLVYIKKTYDRLKGLREKTKPSAAERIFAKWYPLFFSIALALRMTKVTAGWLKYDRSRFHV